WLARVGTGITWLRPVYLGDDLFARQPMCAAVQAAGGHFLFVCKPSSHKTLGEYLNGAELDSLTKTRGRGTEKRIHRYRCSFVTDLPVTRESVAELAPCGRARRKIENETFNVLKTGGYHLEHNFGHGKETLASLLVVLNLLAFAMHNACDLVEVQWQQARAHLFEHIRTVTAYHLFLSWHSLLRTIFTGMPPPPR
ncbi:MAG: hypothetical protein WCJ64_00180, partial [Rhodospirillaceae bacterium]